MFSPEAEYDGDIFSRVLRFIYGIFMGDIQQTVYHSYSWLTMMILFFLFHHFQKLPNRILIECVSKWPCVGYTMT